MAATEIRNYSPKNVAITIDDVVIKSWNNVSIEFTEDRYAQSSAATGETTMTRNESTYGTVTVTVPQASYDNTTLDDKYSDQDTLAVGVDTQPAKYSLTISNFWGQAKYVVPQALLLKKPNSEFTNESGDREWMFGGDFSVFEPKGEGVATP